MSDIKENPFVSVIIPTTGRKELLEKTVSFLTEQTYPYYEIIIIDQSTGRDHDFYRINDKGVNDSTDENFDNSIYQGTDFGADICADRGLIRNTGPSYDRSNSFKKKITAKEFKNNDIRYIHIDEKGLPYARNTGIIESKGDIILFLDDDIIPDRNLIFNHVRAYKNKIVGCVAGRIIEEPDVLTNSKKPGCTVSLSGRVLMNLKSASSEYVNAGKGANISFLKEAIDKTGDFDIRFKGNFILEETDYCYRIRKSGYSVLFEPEACVNHLRIKNGGCRLNDPFQDTYYRFHNTILFYLKNMNKIFLPYVFLIHMLIAVKKILLPYKNILKFVRVLNGLFDGCKSYYAGNKR